MTEIDNDGLVSFRSVFNQNELLAASPNALAHVLVERCNDWKKPSALIEVLKLLVGENGLILAEGHLHKRLRKVWSPPFSFAQVRRYYPMMMDKAAEMVELISPHRQNVPAGEDGYYAIEMGDWAERVSADIIGVVCLGRDTHALYNSEDELMENYRTMVQPSFEKSAWFAANMILRRPLVRLLPWKMNRRMNRASEALQRICEEHVRERKDSMAASKTAATDVVSGLVQSDQWHLKVVSEQLLTILSAGQVTTAATLQWALYLLARHPTHQASLRTELLGATSSLANADHEHLASTLERLPYLNGVIDETLRLYPTVPLTRRISVRDTRVCDRFVPKGTNIDIPIWTLNRLPTLWDRDPSKFLPERWIDSAPPAAHGGASPPRDSPAADARPNHHGGRKSNYALSTFLHGPRNCFGQGFARAELRVLIAAFVRGFEFEMLRVGEEVVPFGFPAVKPKGGLWLRVRKVGA